ncbi:uncharacterized protein LOC121112571 isoform X2 [Gallus gallus]|uniref:uncharacterized protein LOC121112571 isoform X2 n=1 Tax=Gallus gallus TaxID=9031 RepID=UPI001AEB484B|nr:uncharacterized protein LOC121112571 isoform X2 [Gallus gallus]
MRKSCRVQRCCSAAGQPRGSERRFSFSESPTSTPGVMQKDLNMSWRDFGEAREPWTHPEESGDVPEESWGIQGVLIWVWRVLDSSDGSGDVLEVFWGDQGVLESSRSLKN